MSTNTEYDEYDDIEIAQPPPNKKYRVTPFNEYNETDLLPPDLSKGNLLPIPSPPKPETKESIQQLLAPYKQKIIKQNTNKIQHPRISIIKHKKNDNQKIKEIDNNNNKNNDCPSKINETFRSNTVSRATSESSTMSGYVTVHDIPDSCWSLIFHFCTVDDLIFNISATNKFFQSLVIDTSTWIHRKVILPANIYNPSIPKLVEHTLESMFLNWTTLKQLDIMLGKFFRNLSSLYFLPFIFSSLITSQIRVL